MDEDEDDDKDEDYDGSKLIFSIVNSITLQGKRPNYTQTNFVSLLIFTIFVLFSCHFLHTNEKKENFFYIEDVNATRAT